jgi:hypothetical protein
MFLIHALILLEPFLDCPPVDAAIVAFLRTLDDGWMPAVE